MRMARIEQLSTGVAHFQKIIFLLRTGTGLLEIFMLRMASETNSVRTFTTAELNGKNIWWPVILVRP
jgi:hypothetical protein